MFLTSRTVGSCSVAQFTSSKLGTLQRLATVGASGVSRSSCKQWGKSVLRHFYPGVGADVIAHLQTQQGIAQNHSFRSNLRINIDVIVSTVPLSRLRSRLHR